MKKLLLSISITCKVLLAQGSHELSDITFRAYDYSLIAVTIDRVSLGAPDDEIVVAGITPGYHLIEISKVMGYSHHYGANMQNVYRGRVFVPEGVSMRTLIDRYNRFVIIDQLAFAPVINQPYQVVSNNVVGTCNTGMQYYNATPAYIRPEAFAQLRNIIAAQSFESAKIKIAKQAISANRVSAMQVLELMQLFTFESYKLELAKFAYAYTADQQNYYLVNNGFTFSSSINNLAAYIAGGNQGGWN